MPMGFRYRHSPVPDVSTVETQPFSYSGLVFLAYGVLTPLAAAGAALLLKAAGQGAQITERMFADPLAPAPSWSNVVFGAGAPELALAGGLVGLLLWRRLWRATDPVLGPELMRGLLLGAAYSLLLIPIGIMGLYLRTAPKDIPWLMQPLFAVLLGVLGSFYVVILPWIWGTVVLLGGVTGAVTAGLMVVLKRHPARPS